MMTEEIEKEAKATSRPIRYIVAGLVVITLVAVMGLIGALIVQNLDQRSAIQRLRTNYDNLYVDYQTVCGRTPQACADGDITAPQDVPDLDDIQGETGPAGATGATGQQGPMGPPGEDGSDGQDGQDGKPGEVGSPGTPGAAGSNGQDGEDGEDGEDGQDGTNGTNGEVGPQGPPGNDGAPGTPGINGTNGTNGVDGRGVVTIECVDDDLGGSYWLITYSDATTSTTDGPCRVPTLIGGMNG